MAKINLNQKLNAFRSGVVLSVKQTEKEAIKKLKSVDGKFTGKTVWSNKLL